MLGPIETPHSPSQASTLPNSHSMDITGLLDTEDSILLDQEAIPEATTFNEVCQMILITHDHLHDLKKQRDAFTHKMEHSGLEKHQRENSLKSSL